jgi:hypothetical protein
MVEVSPANHTGQIESFSKRPDGQGTAREPCATVHHPVASAGRLPLSHCVGPTRQPVRSATCLTGYYAATIVLFTGALAMPLGLGASYSRGSGKVCVIIIGPTHTPPQRPRSSQLTSPCARVQGHVTKAMLLVAVGAVAAGAGISVAKLSVRSTVRDVPSTCHRACG